VDPASASTILARATSARARTSTVTAKMSAPPPKAMSSPVIVDETFTSSPTSAPAGKEAAENAPHRSALTTAGTAPAGIRTYVEQRVAAWVHDGALAARAHRPDDPPACWPSLCSRRAGGGP
jgi:hypothetical protein